MTLTQAEKDARKRERMLEKAREYTVGTYSRKFVAPVFQRMVRAEWACGVAVVDSRSVKGYTAAVKDGEIAWVHSEIGQCVCVTCGKVLAWDSGIKGMHTGHFLDSRRNSILFEELNVAPQCSHCNYYRSGAQKDFHLWMEHARGIETIERLQQLKTTIVQFSRDELVDMRIRYSTRLKAAEERMKNG